MSAVVIAAITLVLAAFRARRAMTRHRVGEWAVVCTLGGIGSAYLFQLLDPWLAPNLGFLGFHLALIVAAAGGGLVAVGSRYPTPPRAAVLRRVAAAAAVAAAYTALYLVAAKVPGQYSMRTSSTQEVVVTMSVTFSLYASACAADAGLLCWKARAFSRSQWTRIGLVLVAAACAVTVLAGSYSVVTGVSTLINPATFLPSGDLIGVAAAVLLVLGLVVSPAIDALMRWSAARREQQHLRPLWQTVTEHVSAVKLDPKPPVGAVVRAEIAAMRYRVEIVDAINHIGLLDRDPSSITADADPMRAAGSHLGDPNRWTVLTAASAASTSLGAILAATGREFDVSAIADGFNQHPLTLGAT